MVKLRMGNLLMSDSYRMVIPTVEIIILDLMISMGSIAGPSKEKIKSCCLSKIPAGRIIMANPRGWPA